MTFAPPRRQLTSLLILGGLGAALAIAASDCSRTESSPVETPPPAPPAPPPAPPPPPVITMTLTPTAVQFTDTVSLKAPAGLTIAVASADTNTVKGLAVGTIAYSTGASGWLTTKFDTTIAPAKLTLAVKDSTLAAGSYTATVPVTSTSATNSPESVTVSLKRAPAPPPPPPPPPNGASITIATAGNMGQCGNEEQRLSSQLVANMNPDYFIPLGNMVQARSGPVATLQDFQDCYDPLWGQFKNKTFAVMGRDEVDGDTTSATAGYAPGADAYFGPNIAGPPGKNYWSTDLNGWHVIFLNIEGGGPLRPVHIRYKAGSEQLNWLIQDLQNHHNMCTVAFFFEPMWISSNDPPTSTDPNPNHDYRDQPIRGIWTALYQYHADLVINGSIHLYERFAPGFYANGYQNPTPAEVAPDSVNGVRQITSGLAGDGPLATPTFAIANPLLQYLSGGNGVLKLVLGQGSYSWQFINTHYSNVQDSGTGNCHQ